jgi:hypothetical protein
MRFPGFRTLLNAAEALNRGYVREFNTSRKDTHWGRHKLKRDA